MEGVGKAITSREMLIIGVLAAIILVVILGVLLLLVFRHRKKKREKEEYERVSSRISTFYFTDMINFYGSSNFYRIMTKMIAFLPSSIALKPSPPTDNLLINFAL